MKSFASLLVLAAGLAVNLMNPDTSYAQRGGCNVQQSQSSVSQAAAIQNQAVADQILRLQQQQLQQTTQIQARGIGSSASSSASSGGGGSLGLGPTIAQLQSLSRQQSLQHVQQGTIVTTVQTLPPIDTTVLVPVQVPPQQIVLNNGGASASSAAGAAASSASSVGGGNFGIASINSFGVNSLACDSCSRARIFSGARARAPARSRSVSFSRSVSRG